MWFVKKKKLTALTRTLTNSVVVQFIKTVENYITLAHYIFISNN